MSYAYYVAMRCIRHDRGLLILLTLSACVAVSPQPEPPIYIDPRGVRVDDERAESEPDGGDMPSESEGLGAGEGPDFSGDASDDENSEGNFTAQGGPRSVDSESCQEVVLRNLTQETEARAPVASNGSFSVSIDAEPGDELELQAVCAGLDTEPVAIGGRS